MTHRYGMLRLPLAIVLLAVAGCGDSPARSRSRVGPPLELGESASPPTTPPDAPVDRQPPRRIATH